MKRSVFTSTALVAVSLGLFATDLQGAAAVEPLAHDRVPVVVSLGDSFMSGEGGRWEGNAYRVRKSSGAYPDGLHDRGWQIYRDSFNQPVDGNFDDPDTPQACHRSDTSIVNTVADAMHWRGINLACSGAETTNVTVTDYRGEAPQVERLRQLVRDRRNDVKAVLISIGGNDLGFSELLKSCMQVAQTHDCSAQADSRWGGDINGTRRLTDKRAETSVKITETLDAVTEVMRGNGYPDGSYRFVYDGVPKLFAGQPNRWMSMPSLWADFRDSPGVPFHDNTVTWSNQVAVPLINEMMRQAARRSSNQRIEFLDLADAFKGHELSSMDTQQYDDETVQRGAYSEWVVALDPNYIWHRNGSPRLQESFHPNAFGQQMIGRCVAEVLGRRADAEYRCVGVPEQLAVRVKVQRH